MSRSRHRWRENQLAVEIDHTGIISKGRKFYPTEGEKNYINVANSELEDEDGYKLTFEVKGKTFYIAVCYDIFGIRHSKLVNPGTDYILNLIHVFFLEMREILVMFTLQG